MAQRQNLINQKFGRLTVIAKDEALSNKHHRAYWVCKCECGNIKSIAGLSLIRGATQSCGCLRNERVFASVAKDEIGNKYGKLTVLSMDTERSYKGDIQWICKCECGNIISVSGASLRSGNTQSCGCYRGGPSKGELKIKSILDNNHIVYKQEYRVKELQNKRFDFAIYENNKIIRFIEFDGEQHFKQSHWEKHKLERTKSSDMEKNKYALEHNIPLIRIPYWEIDNIDLDALFSDKYLIKKE